MSVTLAEFYAKCDAIQPDEYGCKNWPTVCSGAYGQVSITDRKAGMMGSRRKVHRLALERKLGRPIRHGFQANHNCDNPRCVSTEPGHIYEGTQERNMQDRSKRNLEWLVEHREQMRKLGQNPKERERRRKVGLRSENIERLISPEHREQMRKGNQIRTAKRRTEISRLVEAALAKQNEAKL
jgi:hypothetical protein